MVGVLEEEILEGVKSKKYRKGKSMKLCAHSPQTTAPEASIHEFSNSIVVI
jgi:hypothetical protein